MNLDKEYKEDRRFYEYWTLAEALLWCCFGAPPMWEDYSLYDGTRFKGSGDEIDCIKHSGFTRKTLINGIYAEVKFEPFPGGYEYCEYIEKPYGRVEIYIHSDLSDIKEYLIENLIYVIVAFLAVFSLAYFLTEKIQKIISEPISKLSEMTHQVRLNKD